MRITTTIEIGSSAARVFHWLGDPSRAMQWMTGVSRTEIVERKPGWVGTTFRETVEEDGRGTELQGVVTEYVANQHMAFHLEGAYNNVDVVWTLEEKEKVTRVSQVAEIRFRGPLKLLSVLFGPAFKRKIKSQSQQELSMLKQLCEGEGRLETNR